MAVAVGAYLEWAAPLPPQSVGILLCSVLLSFSIIVSGVWTYSTFKLSVTSH